MELSIETIGDQEEIRNPYMEEALAAGVEHNMDVVDQVLNEAWLDPQEVDDLDQGVPDAANDVHVFLREVMRDEDAAVVATGAAEDYLLDQITELPSPGLPDADHDGVDPRTEALRNIGTLNGVFVAAEGNVVAGSIEDYIARQEAKADAVNFLVGLVPFADGAIGSVNDLADIGGVSLGEVLYEADHGALTEAQQATLLDSEVNNAILLALGEHPERATMHISDMSPEQLEEFYRWATSPGVYDGGDHDSLRAATWDVATTFMGDT
jgi:hypothetical protein